ncbi:hypothetical protein GOBAR_AA05245 [Gossypium barbadense]|uniref:DUF3444 domain-containing protein n=1 Tax=Gossypium barbadense TaxID=3634 RepID=A0A2P5YIF1_GOSBA|nr:hypothetical protein GOBAR_AA05245 [Gossypium barbadense]
MEKLTDSELIELNKTNPPRTMNEIQDRASSVLLLNLQWKEMEEVLDSVQSSVEERLKEVISKEGVIKEDANKIERNEKFVKEQFERLKSKAEELGRQFRGLEAGKKCYEERLREVELAQKQLEEKQEEFVLKQKAFDMRCRDFELEKKEVERHRKDLELSVKRSEQQREEVKFMKEQVKDKLEEVRLKEKDLEKCLSEYESKEEQFRLKEKSFEKRIMEFDLQEKATEERCRGNHLKGSKQAKQQVVEFPNVRDGKKGVDMPMPNAAMLKGSGTSRNAKKRGRKSALGTTVKAGESKGKEEEPVSKTDKVAPVISHSESGAGVNLSSEVLEYPDPEFSDFEKQRAENCFAVNQVWAIYDSLDSMPRFYARIKNVFNPGFKLRITWLEADPDEENEQNWVEQNLPVSCGNYCNGSTEDCVDRLMFSHRIYPIKSFGKFGCLVYPKKGEIWALFKDWNIEWASEPENHKPAYRYDFVEVLTNFDKEMGIWVSHLDKVKGFVSIFKQTARDGVICFRLSSRDLYRFSHQIPAVKMTGKEREGVPVGSFELDPASLPTDLILEKE